jgi:rhodanese-related sulfurtransferase
MSLPDETLVYPAHGAGSLCGKNLSEETVSTLGDQKTFNYALQPMSREKFISLVTENQPQAPKYFSFNARLNKRERQSLQESLESGLKPLSLDQLLEKQRQGAQILDTRPETDFNAAHFKGAVQVGLGGKFATWVGIVLSPETPIVLITEPGAEYESEIRLGRIGFDRVDGYLENGMAALEKRPDLIGATPSWTAGDLVKEHGKGALFCIVDVRSPSEFEESRLKNALNIPLNDLEKRLEEIPKDRPALVHCAGGYRSTIACSLLQKNGLANAINLIGGLEAVSGESQYSCDLLEMGTARD